MFSRSYTYIFIVVSFLCTLKAEELPRPSIVNSTKDAVRCLSLPCTRSGDTLEIYITQDHTKSPANILVLCPDPGVDMKGLLTNSEWSRFAEERHLGLVTVKALNGPDIKTPTQTAASQAKTILQTLDREFGPRASILVYSYPQKYIFGTPQQALVAEGLLASDPKRVVGWCLRAPIHIPESNSNTSPGIVISYKEDKHRYDSALQEFIFSRKKGARLTWIAMAGDRPDSNDLLYVDPFVQDYFSSILAPKIGATGWYNIYNKQPINVADINSRPEQSSYLPQRSLATKWATLHVTGGTQLAQQTVFEREEATFNDAQPKIHLYLRKPFSAMKADKRTSGVLAFCTVFKDREQLLGRLQDKDDFLVHFAEEHNLALLTWDTAEAWNNSESADQRSQQENFQDNLGFAKLANAWERGIHALCHDANLPENRFLLYGISRGAQWAHRLALRKPEYFLAVHVHVNSSYDWPTPAGKNILWLQTTGEREAGYDAARRFYARCRDMGYPIIFKAGENLGHSDSPKINKLGLSFFEYALNLKTKLDNLAPDAKVFVSSRTNLNLYELSGLAQAPFYADLINQDVYRADQKELVPIDQRVPLPTKDIAQSWGELP